MKFSMDRHFIYITVSGEHKQ
jgi:hypothetical protein